MRFLVAVCVLSLVACTGCGPATESVPVQEPAAAAEIRSSLDHLAETGVVDSGIVLLEERIQELQETDAATANELAADLEELKAAGSPSAVKRKASEMREKL